MHQRKSKKILIYFFLLISVGSITNINFNNLKFYEIKDINLHGLNEYNNKLLIENIKNLNLDSIFFLNRNKISKILEKNTMIENYRIFKNYPSALDIKIEKTIFLAKINHENKIYYIGTNGKLSYLNSSNKELPYIFGKPEINDFFDFKKILDESEIKYERIKSLFFFKSKRWDIELKDNTIIKLSKNFSKETLNDVFMIMRDENFENTKIIDARVKNQIILND